MKINKKANGKDTVKIAKKDWESIGKKAGWMKQAQEADKGIDRQQEIKEEMDKIMSAVSKIKTEDGMYALNDGTRTKLMSLDNLQKYFAEYFEKYSDQFIPSVNEIKTRKALIKKGGDATMFLEIGMNVWPFYIDFPPVRFMIASASDVKRSNEAQRKA